MDTFCFRLFSHTTTLSTYVLALRRISNIRQMCFLQLVNTNWRLIKGLSALLPISALPLACQFVPQSLKFTGPTLNIREDQWMANNWFLFLGNETTFCKKECQKGETLRRLTTNTNKCRIWLQVSASISQLSGFLHVLILEALYQVLIAYLYNI